jgi:cytochrome c553
MHTARVRNSRPFRRSLLLALVSTLAGAAAGCGSAEETTDSTEGAQTEAYAAVWATAQWKDRATWYTTPQGSPLVDYGVFLTLEQADSKEPFATRASLERFGFVYPPAEANGRLTSDERLPLGVIKDVVKDLGDKKAKDYVGFTCATCHTGEIKVDGKRVLVDGGQTFLQFEPFVTSLQDALSATLRDTAKKQRFCAKLNDASGCDARLADSKARIDGLRARNRVTVPDGPGRLDAVTRILNEIFSPTAMGGQLGGEKPVDVQVPISIPHVWDAPRLTCVQTNCLATNSMTRNTGEVLGVFGHAALVRVGDKLAVNGTPKVENLLALEKSLESLQSPKWETTFGALDAAKVKRGEALYEKTCASCHTEPYKKTPGSLVEEKVAGQTRALWKVTTMPYEKAGTDPRFIQVHGARKVDDDTLRELFDQSLKAKVNDVFKFQHDGVDPGPVVLEGLFLGAKTKQVFDGIRTLDGKISTLLVLASVTGTLERTAVAQKTTDAEAAEKLMHEYEFYRAPSASVELANYRARPLNGIAFTFPYGHNGAWPTLRDVLAPPAMRTKKFVVRPGSFDPKNVGLDISPAKPGEKLFELDTTQVANSKEGHDYGTDLGETDKSDLLEYVKSL